MAPSVPRNFVRERRRSTLRWSAATRICGHARALPVALSRRIDTLIPERPDRGYLRMVDAARAYVAIIRPDVS
jgi:hypothetical protein